jgi:hypothetical protein
LRNALDRITPRDAGQAALVIDTRTPRDFFGSIGLYGAPFLMIEFVAQRYFVARKSPWTLYITDQLGVH